MAVLDSRSCGASLSGRELDLWFMMQLSSGAAVAGEGMMISSNLLSSTLPRHIFPVSKIPIYHIPKYTTFKLDDKQLTGTMLLLFSPSPSISPFISYLSSLSSLSLSLSPNNDRNA